MNITSYRSVSALDQQIFNLDLMMPIKEKLENIQELINRHERALVGSTCKNRQLIREDHELARHILILNSLDLQMSERIQVEEKKSLVHLKVFI